MSHIEFSQISKSYDGKTQVLKNINFSVKQGEFVVLVGPSGCGKSTLLRMIAGLEGITGGQIKIGDTVVNDLPPRDRDIAMVFQDYALYPHKTVYDNMAFGLQLRKTPAAEIDARVQDAAQLLQITHLLQRKPRELSGGQRQRVAIGRAIVRQPKVFLFDEPLSNLDAQLRGDMRSEIKRLHQRLGTTIVYVTHDQTEAMTMADHIAIMHGGDILQYDTPYQLYNQPATPFVAGFTGSPGMNLSAIAVKNHSADLGEGISLTASAQADGQYTVGVRPENIKLENFAGALSVSGQVLLTEPLGAETVVRFKVGAHEWVARCAPTFNSPVGATLALYIAAERLHWFAG